MATQNNRQQVQAYQRFSTAQRIEHVVLILSFTTLALTGLPQKFLGSGLAEGIINLLGGIEVVRIIHRVSAILFLTQSVYHVLVTIYKVFIQHTELSMLPDVKDATDALDVLRYNLGLTKEHPRMPRYNFAEKAEYWALIWGGIVMGITGFMLWNPIATAKLLPGTYIPAAKAAHGGEAVLAVLAIIVWHFYSVHIKTFNKAMFNGKMTRHQMEIEHGQELEQIEAGHKRRPATAGYKRKRERVFIPVALVVGIMFALGLIWFATFEETAIATLPEPATAVPAFSPLTPTPIPVATPFGGSIGKLITHPVEGRDNCESCHGPEGIRPAPENHIGRHNESCLICHKPGPVAAEGASGGAASGPAAIPHPIDVAAYETCTTCHGAGGLKPFPDNHASFSIDTCTACHKPAATPAESGASGDGATPEAANTPASDATPETDTTPGAPPKVPHAVGVEPYIDCTTCHGPGMAKPVPENHVNYPVASCTACHQSQ